MENYITRDIKMKLQYLTIPLIIFVIIIGIFLPSCKLAEQTQTEIIDEFEKEIAGLEQALERKDRKISELEIPVSGKVFVVSVDRRPIYWGAFWTPMSSISFEGFTILKPLTSAQYIIQLELGYPSSDFFTVDDPRSNITIFESLGQAGKLQ